MDIVVLENCDGLCWQLSHLSGYWRPSVMAHRCRDVDRGVISPDLRTRARLFARRLKYRPLCRFTRHRYCRPPAACDRGRRPECFSASFGSPPLQAVIGHHRSGLSLPSKVDITFRNGRMPAEFRSRHVVKVIRTPPYGSGIVRVYRRDPPSREGGGMPIRLPLFGWHSASARGIVGRRLDGSINRHGGPPRLYRLNYEGRNGQT